jgi:hypothetical protein
MTDVFEAATGEEPPSARPQRERDSEVRTAFEGLLQIRRLTNTATSDPPSDPPSGPPSDPASVPAAWELNQMVRAIAIALEASGFPPSALDASGARTATGYRVRPSDDNARMVRVDWLGPPGSGAAQEEEARLTECAATLARFGWEALLYRGPRRRRFLEVEPGNAP